MKKTIQVNIEKMVNGGKGMGYCGEKALFADFLLPGDVALVQVTKEKKRYIIADLVRVDEESPLRIAPECVYFAHCGGCSLFNVDYKTELGFKKEWFMEMAKKGGFELEDDVEIIASTKETHYRNRAQFKISAVNDKVLIGFHKRRTNRVVNIHKCLIINNKINDLLEPLKEMVKALTFNEHISQADFTIDDDEQSIIMVMHINANYTEDRINIIREKFAQNFEAGVTPFLRFKESSAIRPLFNENETEFTKYTIKDSANSFSHDIKLSPGSFIQVNYPQNLQLIDIMLEYLELSADDNVLDLYSGAGNFSFAAAHFCKSVYGVESYDKSVEDAISNLGEFGLSNMEFVANDVAVEVKRLKSEGVEFEKIILDPPRQGAIEVLNEIDGLKAAKIVYISCDMATFFRDAEHLKSIGYSLKKVKLIDMFPRTHHVEVISLFESVAKDS
ncbi:23S rRNA (uracil(1939)-C(5))-methyltransferase RlmD [Thermodesulfobacteriota bacterium]